MVFLKIVLLLVSISFVSSADFNLPKISFDLTIPLNKVLSGEISKEDFKDTLVSTIFFNNDTGSRELVNLLYATGINAQTKHQIIIGLP